MPIYEYRCSECDHRFETLVRGSANPSCPRCESTSLVRELSVFAVGASSTPMRQAAAGPCTTCGDPRGPGSCALN
ncbi:MAG TPA: zinc ribbon domain-containing protein [Vicinamibacterales bacterium]